jgi:HEAT repeat protein
MALIALGWFGARYTPERFGGVAAGLTGSGPVFSSVQSVEPDAAGNVHISVDQVRRHVVTGDLGDPQIQQLLLEAMREESNPGVRAESIVVLENRTGSEQVRQALVDAATHDPNAGVRLRAVEGLKPYADNPSVRSTLTGVLLKDENAGVRMQAVELLSAHHDDSIIGALQDAVQKEHDLYVRGRCRDLLQAMKASVGTY